jgi:hypothetical protein
MRGISERLPNLYNSSSAFVVLEDTYPAAFGPKRAMKSFPRATNAFLPHHFQAFQGSCPHCRDGFLRVRVTKRRDYQLAFELITRLFSAPGIRAAVTRLCANAALGTRHGLRLGTKLSPCSLFSLLAVWLCPFHHQYGRKLSCLLHVPGQGLQLLL